MTGVHIDLAGLHAMLRRFEGQIAAAKAKVPHRAASSTAPEADLLELSGYGSNPGELRMLAHVPGHLQAGAPLVVALHGCGQSAAEYASGAGWSALADRLGFAVIYPEQIAANNPKCCFSWFQAGDIARDTGEALSIRQMVAHAIAAYGLDRSRVYVTGLSAGGAMTAVMLATYPEVFAGGAVIAGLPYGCATSVQQAMEAMFTEQGKATPASMLGARVKAASGHRGPWPRLSVWHGSADAIVVPANADLLARQWTDVHGLAERGFVVDHVGGHRRRVWRDDAGVPVIEAVAIAGMAHGVPIATAGPDACGAPGPFFLDVGVSSTAHIASFWGLGALEAAATGPQGTPGPGEASADRQAAVPDPSPAHGAPWQGLPAALDPSVVIAEAFKAAGLPVPKLPLPTDAAGAAVDPQRLIDAALRSAGLRRG